MMSSSEINPNADEQTALEFALSPNIQKDKALDALVPGLAVPYDPDEAEEAGAFEEDAISIDDALDAVMDGE